MSRNSNMEQQQQQQQQQQHQRPQQQSREQMDDIGKFNNTISITSNNNSSNSSRIQHVGSSDYLVLHDRNHHHPYHYPSLSSTTTTTSTATSTTTSLPTKEYKNMEITRTKTSSTSTTTAASKETIITKRSDIPNTTTTITKPMSSTMSLKNDAATPVVPPKVSRLTQKLSKHRKPSSSSSNNDEFPADEITLGASTVTNSNNNNNNDLSCCTETEPIHVITTTTAATTKTDQNISIISDTSSRNSNSTRISIDEPMKCKIRTTHNNNSKNNNSRNYHRPISSSSSIQQQQQQLCQIRYKNVVVIPNDDNNNNNIEIVEQHNNNRNDDDDDDQLYDTMVHQVDNNNNDDNNNVGMSNTNHLLLDISCTATTSTSFCSSNSNNNNNNNNNTDDRSTLSNTSSKNHHDIRNSTNYNNHNNSNTIIPTNDRNYHNAAINSKYNTNTNHHDNEPQTPPPPPPSNRNHLSYYTTTTNYNDNDNDDMYSMIHNNNNNSLLQTTTTTTTTTSSDNTLPTPTITTHNSSSMNNSSIPTISITTPSFVQQQQQQQQIHDPPQMKRYNHYDWSFAEEDDNNNTSTPNNKNKCNTSGYYSIHSSTSSGTTSSTSSGIVHEHVSFDDNSTLATMAISNTSQQNISFNTTTTTTSPNTSIDISPHDTSRMDQHNIIQRQQQQILLSSSCSNVEDDKYYYTNKFTETRNLHDPIQKNSRSRTKPITSNNNNIKAFGNKSNNNSSNIDRDTVVLVEGKDETLDFRHSSLILQYASNVISKHLIECMLDEDDTVNAKRDGTIQYILHIQVHERNSPHDWKIVQPFLEPHAVQPAIVTPTNLPILLPWFQQLHLPILMQECDTQLLFHLVIPPSKVQILNNSSVTSPSLNEYYVTISNTILLAQIAVKAGLDRTSKQAFLIASTWLTKFPYIWLLNQKQRQSNDSRNKSITLIVLALNLLTQCLKICEDESMNSSAYDDSHEMDSSFESVNSSSLEFMFHPSEAAQLFTAMISYLPSDCVQQQQLQYRKSIYSLLRNPLIPYLIREGIQKHFHKQVQIEMSTTEPQRTSEVQLPSNEGIEVMVETEMFDNVSKSVSPVPFQQARDIESHETTNKLDSNSSLIQVAEGIHTGWNTLWLQIAGAAIVPNIIDADNNESNDDSTIRQQQQLDKNKFNDQNNNNTMYQQMILNRTFSDQHSEILLLQDPQELSIWLYDVWDNLCHPPIFIDTTKGSDSQIKYRQRFIQILQNKNNKNIKLATTSRPSDTITNGKDRNVLKNQHHNRTAPLVSALRGTTTNNSTTKSKITTKDKVLSSISQRRTFAC